MHYYRFIFQSLSPVFTETGSHIYPSDIFKEKHFNQTISYFKTTEQNRVNSDEVAHSEPFHLDLHCLQVQLHVFSFFGTFKC